MKPKVKKSETISKLAYETTALKAQMFHTAYFAHGELATISKRNFAASAVIVTITDLSGKVIMMPVAVRDGLSKTTIQALQEDIKRSQKGLKDSDLNKELTK